ncbi:MAG: pitrilysin family protein [Desulfobacterales bacterium]|jgi:predicted Zn-dependent peptidase
MTAPVNKTVLSNGIRVLTKSLPQVRSVSMGVWVDVGARDESPEESGLSHFIEHMIFKGTRRRSAYQIAKEFDAIGGQTNAFTTMESTCYHAKVLDAHLDTMVDILADIFLHSVFDRQEVERERPVIFQEIGMLEDNPEEYIHLLAGKAYWGDAPLGASILGSRENITRFTAENIVSFFKKYYQPERIVISAAGHLDHVDFVDKVAAPFESVQPGDGLPPRIAPRGRQELALHGRSLEQVHICLTTGGVSITDPRRYPMALMNTILGGNMSSRLFQEIRERRGLAYSVYSFISSFVDTGMFGAYVGVDPKNTRTVVELLLTHLRQLASAPVSQSELTDAKEFTKGNLLLSAESVDNQMVRIAQNEIHFGRNIPMGEVVSAVDSVTSEEIQVLARSILAENPMALTLLGPVSEQDVPGEILES